METVSLLEVPPAAEAAVTFPPQEQAPVKDVNDSVQVQVSSTPKAVDKAAVSGAAGPSAQHPKYSVMIRDAIVLMKQRKGVDCLTIAKAIETRHKSQLPSNFHKMLQLQLRNLVRSGKLIRDQSRYRCTPWFRKNPEARRPLATQPPATRTRTRKRKRTPATTRQQQPKKPSKKKKVNGVKAGSRRTKTSAGKKIRRPSRASSSRPHKSRRTR